MNNRKIQLFRRWKQNVSAPVGIELTPTIQFTLGISVPFFILIRKLLRVNFSHFDMNASRFEIILIFYVFPTYTPTLDADKNLFNTFIHQQKSAVRIPALMQISIALLFLELLHMVQEYVNARNRVQIFWSCCVDIVRKHYAKFQLGSNFCSRNSGSTIWGYRKQVLPHFAY